MKSDQSIEFPLSKEHAPPILGNRCEIEVIMLLLYHSYKNLTLTYLTPNLTDQIEILMLGDKLYEIKLQQQV